MATQVLPIPMALPTSEAEVYKPIELDELVDLLLEPLDVDNLVLDGRLSRERLDRILKQILKGFLSKGLSY